MNKRIVSIAGLAVIAVIVLAVNLAGTLMFRQVKIDLTEEKLFTLSEGSINIIESLEDDLTLKLYFSKTAASSESFIKSYADLVIQLLNEYRSHAAGKISLQIIDPRPDTEDEEWAMRYGLKAFPGGRNGEPIYLGLVLKDESDHEDYIYFFNPNAEGLLEYTISKKIADMAQSENAKRVGILSSLEVMGGAPNYMQQMQQPPSPPWILIQEMGRGYEMVKIETDAEEIPDDLKLLLIIHPKNLAESTLYAIDQYVLSGGNALVFLDPLSEAERETIPAGNYQMMMSATYNSDMPQLLNAWGVEMRNVDANNLVADPKLAARVQTQEGMEQMIVWLDLMAENRNADEIVTSELERFMLASSGALNKISTSDDIEIVPLLETTDTAGMISDFTYKMGGGPDALLRDFEEGSSKLVLAYKISGLFKTAFPDGNPQAPDAEDNAAPKADDNHLSKSESRGTVIVVADSDMITDRFSVRKSNFFGHQIVQPTNDNMSFFVNAVENLTGSQDLIALRSRGLSQRPFTRVRELELEAQEKWKAEEDTLQEKLDEANQRLNDLQRGTQEKQILNNAYMEEVQKLRDDKAEMQAKLRNVKRKLREDVERLGFNLKFINIALIPLAVTFLSIFVMVVRSLRRRVSA